VKYAVLAGRQLFSAIFIIASARHFSPQTIDAAAGHGVPLPGLLLPLSGIIALIGGLMKNVTMLGGALVISYFGAGPLSLDALLSQREDSGRASRLSCA
jgi:putative oxidoreductase